MKFRPVNSGIHDGNTALSMFRRALGKNRLGQNEYLSILFQLQSGTQAGYTAANHNKIDFS